MCRGTPTRQPFRPGSFLRNKKTLYAERIDPDLNHTSFDPCYCSGEALAGQIINTSSDICHSSPSLSSVLRLHVSNIAWIKVSHHSAATAVFAGATSFAVCPQEFRQQERKMSLHKERDNQMARALCTSSERFNANGTLCKRFNLFHKKFLCVLKGARTIFFNRGFVGLQRENLSWDSWEFGSSPSWQETGSFLCLSRKCKKSVESFIYTPTGLVAQPTLQTHNTHT